MTAVHWVCLGLVASSTIYAITSGAYFFAGRPGMALAFVGYVLANCGLVWDAITQ